MNYNANGNAGEIKEVSTYDIVVDKERHPRAEIYEEVIFEITKALKKGARIPPIAVFFDGETYRLADGFYRFEAYRLEGFDLIPAIVQKGGKKEALIHAVGANANHGLRRTNADKKKAVIIALTDPDLQGLSDNQLATIIKVSQPYVGKIRNWLTYNGFKFPATRVCSNGQKMDTSKIGLKGGGVSATTDPESSEVENDNIVTAPPVEENPDTAENQNQASEEHVGTNNEDSESDEETLGIGGTSSETESVQNDQHQNLEKTEEAGNSGSREEAQLSGSSPPETESGQNSQDQNPEESGDDDLENNGPAGGGQTTGESDTVNAEPDTEEEESGDNESEEGTDDPDASTSDSEEVDPDPEDEEPGDGVSGASEDGTDNPDSETGDSEEIDPGGENEEPGSAGDDEPEEGNLGDLSRDELERMVVQLEEDVRTKDTELEVRTNHIAELEQQVEKISELEQQIKELVEENEYLENQLQKAMGVSSDLSTYSGTNIRNENPALIQA